MHGFAGTLTSQGYNLIQNTAGCTIAGDTTGNRIGVIPSLGPLANNGAPTAIDRGGGIWCGPNVTIANSTINANQSIGAYSGGGGIACRGNLRITNSTISLLALYAS